MCGTNITDDCAYIVLYHVAEIFVILNVRSLQNPEVRVTFPCAGLRQLPLCGLAPGTTLRCKLFPSDKFSEIQLYFFNRIAYNEASEKSESIKLKGERIWN